MATKKVAKKKAPERKPAAPVVTTTTTSSNGNTLLGLFALFLVGMLLALYFGWIPIPNRTANTNGSPGQVAAPPAGVNNGNESQGAPAASSNDGIPVQFGVFPVNGGFGVNVVIGNDETGRGISFKLNGVEITPATAPDCRRFDDAAPFYGAINVTRCDFLFAGELNGELTATVPNGYSIKARGTTLIPNVDATSDHSWVSRP